MGDVCVLELTQSVKRWGGNLVDNLILFSEGCARTQYVVARMPTRRNADNLNRSSRGAKQVKVHYLVGR